MIPNRYEPEGPQFSGGMAQVLLCKDKVLDRRVAIKIMPGGANKRRIRDELKALLKMRSNHVVQVYDVFALGKSDLAIVQEFIDGRDLFDPGLAPGSPDQFMKLMWQLASGISDIHRVSVIHRDIKPNNMKIDPEGVLKIFDFGLARDEGAAASTKGFVGTPGFAAPELYDNQPRFTAAVDTYAFGATALSVAVRRLPNELMDHPPHRRHSAYFSGLDISLPNDVAALLDKCLQTNVNDRPNMEDVADALAKHLLRNKHRALAVFNGRAMFLDSEKPTVRLNLSGIGTVDIRYNGLDFQASAVEGEVFLNANPILPGTRLPGSCVITLGAPNRGNSRQYITFDLSHPEIVL